MSNEPDPEIAAEIRDRETRLERLKQRIADLERAGCYGDAQRTRELLAAATESIGSTRLKLARVVRYRANAERVRRKAETMQDPQTRQHLLMLAERFDQMAESID